jgi:hypothetical protein
MPERPSLAFLIPTYNRVGHVEGLLRALAADPDVETILVADNGSVDETAAAVRAIQAEHPALDLRLQLHGENIGPVANVSWLIEHAPEVDYLWILGDDDRPQPGAVAYVLDALAQRPVTLLHLPHTFERDGHVAAASKCPEAYEVFPGSRDLSLAYHHWVTFISANVVERGALQRACREVPTVNEWGPHIWFLNAAIEAPCAVLPRSLVAGGMDTTWHATRVPILTDRVVESFDVGLHRVMDETDFARYLDDFYPDVGREPWAHVPLERLAAALRRFPASRELRRMLFDNACAQGRRDALAELDAIARAAGAGEAAARLVVDGEDHFARGGTYVAVQCFNAALAELPTLVEAWNDLGVALHAVGDPSAARAFDVALTIDPADADALANRRAVA